uniref:Uncharacterized protein n=2 Tax=Oryza TaxID=4527 RepID=A0A0D3FVS5_9ORYZ
MAVLRELAAVGRLPRCRPAPSPFLELLPFSVGSFYVGLRRQPVSEGSSDRRRDAVQFRVLLRPKLARRSAGGRTEEVWASSQGGDSSMQQVWWSAGGGAPARCGGGLVLICL